jgi:hypothetical protein
MLKVMASFIAASVLFGGAPAANAAQALPAPVQEQSALDAGGFGQPLPSENLAAQSGRQAPQINQLDVLANSNNGQQEGNTITGSSTTGSNSISNGAFTNMNGFATVIQNSGNQVLIQNDLIVNMNMK